MLFIFSYYLKTKCEQKKIPKASGKESLHLWLQSSLAGWLLAQKPHRDKWRTLRGPKAHASATHWVIAWGEIQMWVHTYIHTYSYLYEHTKYKGYACWNMFVKKRELQKVKMCICLTRCRCSRHKVLRKKTKKKIAWY